MVEPKPDIYNPSFLNNQASDAYEVTLVCHYFPQALDIYQELNKRDALLLSEAPDRFCLEQIQASPKSEWAFQNWVNTRNLERQIKSLQAELERLQLQLQQNQVEF